MVVADKKLVQFTCFFLVLCALMSSGKLIHLNFFFRINIDKGRLQMRKMQAGGEVPDILGTHLRNYVTVTIFRRV